MASLEVQIPRSSYRSDTMADMIVGRESNQADNAGSIINSCPKFYLMINESPFKTQSRTQKRTFGYRNQTQYKPMLRKTSPVVPARPTAHVVFADIHPDEVSSPYKTYPTGILKKGPRCKYSISESLEKKSKHRSSFHELDDADLPSSVRLSNAKID